MSDAVIQESAAGPALMTRYTVRSLREQATRDADAAAIHEYGPRG